MVAAAEHADLLVLSRDGDGSRLGPRSLGPAGRFIVDHAPCPVLLVWPGTAPGVQTIPPPPRHPPGHPPAHPPGPTAGGMTRQATGDSTRSRTSGASSLAFSADSSSGSVCDSRSASTLAWYESISR